MDFHIQGLDFFSGPGCFPQESQAGLDAGIKMETPDMDKLSHFLPAEVVHQQGQDHFQCHTMQGIF